MDYIINIKPTPIAFSSNFTINVYQTPQPVHHHNHVFRKSSKNPPQKEKDHLQEAKDGQEEVLIVEPIGQLHQLAEDPTDSEVAG